MSADLSNQEVLILQTMWGLKALGAHTVTMHNLAGRLPGASKVDIAARLARLEIRGLVIKKRSARDDLVALSPLGAAFVRQLQDGQLGNLTSAP
jgi:DNA-binding MarR family transcriptional regulator